MKDDNDVWDIIFNKRGQLLDKMYREMINKPDGKLERLENFDDIMSKIIGTKTYAYLEDSRTLLFGDSIDELMELMRLELSGNYTEWENKTGFKYTRKDL